ncbi:biotin carboxylase N-terminal domain-containing protein [Bosea sp. ANAM02]|uniref:acetyl/propionyl/methylcrotonyl-CoA carboxylase subunit alpha n=1 Tax=Bosea sp. ANAM02 TaxID=2020412 RepID=UPI00140F1D6F|nr:biotin carboxylase N-terminal domain-containing protein [Bosea sp. ANAM02]BCB21221.1 3-methylcrotonyl-CoA carboxylase subunit alpha [Bosea sp. ANAM02]
MIGSLLIANRGEIAVRIMRTCRRLGIHTVAVFSDADRDALHVAYADEAVRIGPAAARDSYLRAEAIMEAAARSGADAIHPGYGFLSEKPDLPLLCRQAGRIFVGPSAECITAMGPKIGSKLIAEKAGVPSVPGYAGAEQSNAALTDAAARIGYPVMIKASAGGGGKGMRRVFSAAELMPALEMARAEAQAAFGDPALLIEKLVMRPRHLEVQVAGDKHGNVVHLFERDCSVQRNNQKVLEEAPAPNLAPAIRAKLLERGVALARAIGYDNLGTVEFILEDGFNEPWFLEMNTRLQVEHPVTEAITGYDLVEWQIRIAAGERLPALQPDIRESGHAIEARITAERADQGFRPDTGRIEGYAEPASIRVDSGVRAGSEVTLFYDSLLAKAIAAGPDRAAACARLAAGLRDFAILGPATTLPFLIDAVEHPLFAQGQATTRFIEDAFPDGWTAKRPRERLTRAVAALLWLEKQAATRPAIDAWNSLAGFRLLAPAGGVATSRLIAEEENGATKLEVRLLPDGRRIVRDPDGEIEVALRSGADSFEITFENRLLRGSHAISEGRVRLTLDGESFDFGIVSEARPAAAAGGSGAGSGAVIAPMPGVVAEVRVAPGDRVETGQVVVVLESMKLFTSLSAEVDGLIAHVTCQPGDTVQAGKRLALIEPSPSS